MLNRLQHVLAGSARSTHTSAVILIDLDNFKALNDTLGHDRGDMLLQQVALRLSASVREGDTVSVSVTLRRTESLSVLRRLGTLLNVAGDPNGSVTITWKEPNPAHVTRTVGGAVPIQSRAMSLDISALSPGPYELVTGIRRGGLPEVTSSRRVTIVK